MKKSKKEPIMRRRLAVKLVFESSVEREAVSDFLNSEGRTPSAFLIYAVREAMKKNGHIRQIVGRPADSSVLGTR